MVENKWRKKYRNTERKLSIYINISICYYSEYEKNEKSYWMLMLWDREEKKGWISVEMFLFIKTNSLQKNNELNNRKLFVDLIQFDFSWNWLFKCRQIFKFIRLQFIVIKGRKKSVWRNNWKSLPKQ